MMKKLKSYFFESIERPTSPLLSPNPLGPWNRGSRPPNPLDPLELSRGSRGCNPLGGPEGRFTSAVKSPANPWQILGN